LALALAACEKDRTVGPEGGGAFRRYVSIGTSISEGWQADGVVYSGQVLAWPALLARQAMAPFGTPMIQAPGCNPPLIAPLQLSRRLTGSATTASTRCAPLFPGITLPQNNVAISGALASEALNRAASATPATTRDSLYARTLAVGQTQVTAMLSQDPTFVSVELGANEVLGAATSGIVVPGVTYVPFAAWEPPYVQIIDSVESTGARALLVTVPLVGSIPSIRSGPELFAVAAEFLAFNIQVNADCQNSPNLIFTPQLVPRKVAEGQALAAQGQRAQLSCADVPGATPDYILTPADTATLNGVVRQMNTRITELASQRGYALLDANAVLQHIVDTRPAYSVVKHLGCTSPFGQFISLDGVHPSNAGHVLIANAAAEAVNDHYGFSIPQIPLTEIPNATLCP
jgi:lysophospholipase L1-like esterase